MLRIATVLAGCGIFLGGLFAKGDGPRDNIATDVRPIPPKGVEIPAKVAESLRSGLAELTRSLADLRKSNDPRTVRLLPDVEIYEKAVDYALKYGEFFNVRDFDKAETLLKEGKSRASSLAKGEAPWTRRQGLVVRGYRSKIDGSAQPFGLVIPESYRFDGERRHRLDLWFHGRGEVLSEVNFIDDRSKNVGTFAPADTIVLHPYGRYCNANKFAGEVDTFEALEAVSREYRVDPDRIAVRGFSMGGAACWQFAVHYSDRWFAANPGAGFSETPQFLKFFQRETLNPPSYESSLWGLYDCPPYASNLFHCPTVAYSGELDNQKQAADVMAKTIADLGGELRHVIGPQTKHSYHPDARRKVDDLLDSLAIKGRERFPAEVRLSTRTLKYSSTHWVTIDRMVAHWTQANVRARLSADAYATPRIVVETHGVSAMTLAFPAGFAPFVADRPVVLEVDGDRLSAAPPRSDRSWSCSIAREGSAWKLTDGPPSGLIKRKDLQGPIDDAFMDSFLMVLPTKSTPRSKLAEWSKSESARAIAHWRSHFRGDARVKNDADVSESDIASSNLILWGDRDSNSLLSKIADKLPISWKSELIRVGDNTYSSDDHALIMIYPNPLNPKRYVVLNSGFTFRDYDYLNNARQVPKLPDWAVVDLKTPPNSRLPGKIAAAGFFGESWELKPSP